MRHIAILGSTGSIGRSSLEVIAAHPDRFRVVALTAHRNVDLLQEQIARFRPRLVAVSDRASADRLHALLNGTTRIVIGEQGLVEAATLDEADMVISALVGFAGLVPTYRAIEAGKDIALANKETMVVGGALITRLAAARNVHLLPVDSEHSAIFQCLQGESHAEVARILLTASGGPFRTLPASEFAAITPAQALAHPTWRMGNKITIDSATLMNKGLEIIEASWLFQLPPDRIDVVVHPQSIIHSMVEFVDGSIKAHLGVPDMKIPIQYALTYPARAASMTRRLDLAALGTMTFFPPEPERFRCLQLAYDALRTGGTAPAVLNAANEVAVELFLDGRIGFMDIPALIEGALDAHQPSGDVCLEELLRLNEQTRAAVRQRCAVVEH